jgi:hypothetical protein
MRMGFPTGLVDLFYTQVAGVQTILDSVTSALRDNPDRKFVYGEMVSCWRMWGTLIHDCGS